MKLRADARLAPARATWVKPVRALLDAGVVVAEGTDYPASDTGGPVFTLVGLVTRQDAAGRPDGGWHPAQAVTVDEALHTTSIGRRMRPSRRTTSANWR